MHSPVISPLFWFKQLQAKNILSRINESMWGTQPHCKSSVMRHLISFWLACILEAKRELQYITDFTCL